MSIFQSFRNFMNEVNKEIEEEEKRQKRNNVKKDSSVSSDEFLERLEQVRQSNRERMDDNTRERPLPQRSQKKTVARQRSRSNDRDRERDTVNQESRETYEQLDPVPLREEDYNYDDNQLDSLSKELQVERYHTRSSRKMKASAEADEIWSRAGRRKRNLRNNERRELLRQGMIMKEILDAPRSKKRRIR